MTQPDPYRHHPELKGQIKPAAESVFRTLDLDAIDARSIAQGRDPNWRTPCEDREAGRRAWLNGRMDQELWVYGYGSLMCRDLGAASVCGMKAGAAPWSSPA